MVTGDRWREPERELAARALALHRVDELLEEEERAGALAFLERLWIEPITVALPMLLISEVQRSGGTLLSRLFDGHPEIHAYPLELYWGSPTEFDWPSLDALTVAPEEAFHSLAAGNAHQIRSFTMGGYQKADRGGGEDHHTFAFSLAWQRREFLRRLEASPATDRRTLLNCFMGSFFTAWLDYQRRYTRGRFVSAFAKRHNFSPALERFFADYPDGRLLTIIRDPASWYASASTHSQRLYGDLGSAIELWRASTLASCRAFNRWPDRIIVIAFEQLVGDTEEVMRRLADRLGLRWDDGLVQPTFNGQPVSSNSSYSPLRGIDAAAGDRSAQLEPGQLAFIRSRAQTLYDESRPHWL
jgi:hypothetical protein